MDKNIMGDTYFNAMKGKIPDEDFERITTFARTGMLLHGIGSLFDSYLQKVGLSKGRFLILVQLFRIENKGLSVKDLHSYHKVTSATMTGLIDTLEKDGFINRAPSKDDRRMINIFLTDKGSQFMEKFLPIHFSNIKNLLHDFPVEKNKQLLSLLNQLLNSFKNNFDNIQEVKSNEQ